MFPIEFRGIEFQDLMPHQGMNVPISLLPCEESDALFVRVGLHQGSTFEPGAHPCHSYITVEHGEGIFRLGQMDFPYEPGSAFFVPAHLKHAFRVREDTIFTKKVFVRQRHAKSMW